MPFTIKAEHLNQPGINLFIQKLQTFPGFSGKSARRISKVCKNINAHWDVTLKKMRETAEELGGTLQGRTFNFTDKVKEKEFNLKLKDLMDSWVEMNCNAISYENDILPYEQALKFTPVDYEMLENFCGDYPTDSETE